MLSQIKTFFQQKLLPDQQDTAQESEHRLRLAVAALLLEMPQMDGEVHPEQCAKAEQSLRDSFDLTRDETDQLIALAQDERREATDYFQFTSLINEHYTPERKIELIEQLWKIAYANRVLDQHEEYLVRKLAQLLHVSHSAFIATKHRAEIDDEAT